MVAQDLRLHAGGAKRRRDLVEGNGVGIVVADEEWMAPKADDLLGAVFKEVLLHAEAPAAEEEGGVRGSWEFVRLHGWLRCKRSIGRSNARRLVFQPSTIA